MKIPEDLSSRIVRRTIIITERMPFILIQSNEAQMEQIHMEWFGTPWSLPKENEFWLAQNFKWYPKQSMINVLWPYPYFLLRISSLSRAHNSFQHSLQCILHLFVPQAIDYRVHHGKYHSIKNWDYFVCIQFIAGTRTEVHKKEGTIEKGNSCQVGGASGKSFVASSCRGNSQNGAKYKGIWDQDDHEGAQLYKATQSKEKNFIDIGVGTGES